MNIKTLALAAVTAYRYQISYLPEAIIPVELKRG